MHPHPASVRRILSKELELSDVGGSSVLSEEEFCSSPERLEQLSKEALLADQCIVASSFTGQTLVENGVPKDRIHLVPLGVELGRYSDRPKEIGPFRVVFVGQMVQRKGLEYLLKAWKRLRLPNAELVLAGRGRVDRRLLAEFASEFKYVGELSNAELRELYITSDLFCMPSLVEGYGLVYLEALACGLPVIATRNTGAADMVQDGREGFIVPIQDVEALAEKLEWAYRNRAALTEMRTAARSLAEQYSWLRFRRELIGVIEEVESRHAVSSN
jgi:glycosyltransferase involved in cell wall biosynthesis